MSKIEKKDNTETFQTGFLKVGDDLEKVQFTPEGEFARIDGCTRVPLNLIKSDQSAIRLRSEKGVDLWPEGIIPYVIVNAPADFEENFMKIAVK